MLNKILGYLATLSWATLSGVTFLGIFIPEHAILPINLIMSLVFALISTFVAWRVKATSALGRAFPDSPEVISLLRIDAISNLSMLIAGGLLSFAAGLRVWSEGMAVFG